jgi:cytoskeletal protein CcmA (bactofilin family)
MVKNLPSVERSTKIRFGKYVPDSNDQEENTIVFNASNIGFETPYSNACYLSPIRNRTDYSAPEVVLLMYDRATKEITESGESASALVGGATLDIVTNRSNTTANTLILTGNTAFATYGNIGILNTTADHTVSVGSNLYIDEFGSNVLTVVGNVYVQSDVVIDGNLTVNGDTTVIYTENTSIKDALIELGRDNTSGDSTLDLGVLMHRPDVLSNVVIGYREETDEFAIAYTDAQPTDKTFTPKTDEDINVHVYGLTHVDANIYAHEDVLVTGNTYVSGNVVASKDLTLSGNAYVSGNVVASKDLTLSGNAYVSGNVVASKDLTLSGNAYVSGNVVASKDLTLSGNAYVSGNVVASKDLTLSGNAYVSGNVVAYKDLTLSGNAYVTGNVNVTKQLSVSGNAYVSGNVEVTESLIVSGNTHLEGDNVFITHTMDFLDPTTAIVTDQVSNVQIRLGQLENVANTVSNPSEDHLIVYDGTQWVNDYPMHTYVKIRNDEDTATIERGDAVYVKGTHNSNILNVGLAHSDDATTMPCIGLSNQQLTVGEQGTAIAYGKALSIVTSGFIAGETLYVSNTVPGGLSNVKPYNNDLIQNVGVVTKVHGSNGGVFVTGIGRSNDIPNAPLITDYNDMNYVYVNNINNDLKKITSANLNIPLTTAVSSSSNSVANAVTLRGVSITSGDGFHGDLVVAGNVTVDTNTLKVDAEANRVGILTASPGQTLDVRGAANVGTFTTTTGTVTDGTHSTSKDTGVLVLTQGGLGVEANIHSTNVFATSHIAVGTSATSNTFDVRGTANVGALVTTSTHISDSTATTSKTTGALQVTGGVGIQGDIHATHANLEDVEADSVTVTDATAATDKTTGALKVTGGVGVQGDLYATDGHFSTDVSVGSLTNKKIPYANASKILTDSQISQEADGTVVISNDVEISGSLLVGGESFTVSAGELVVQDRIIDIANNNPDHDLDIGILMEHPGHNIGLIHHPEDYFAMGYTQNGYSDTHILRDYSNEFTLNVWGYVVTQNTVTIEHNDLYVKDGLIGVNTDSPLADLHVVGNVFVTSNITTSSNVLVNGDAAATSKTTGALQVTGGVGVQGALYGAEATFDGVTSVINSTAATGKTDGSLVVTGGVGVSGALYGAAATFDGVTSITNATAATNKTDGALVVTGGTGISGALYGAEATFDGVTSVTNSTAATGKTDGALVVTGGVGVSGALYGATASFDGVTSVTNATAATGKTDGALVVTGGVGVSGALYGATASFDGETAATNKTSGALVVTGGVGVSGALYGATASFDGVTSVTNATAATSKTDGALVVAGGVGISGDIYGAAATFDDLTVDGTTLTVDTGNNRVGIGMNNPGFTLDVTGDINFSGSLYEGGSPFAGSPWTTSGSDVYYTTGNVGIGTNAPTTELHVAGGTITNSDQVAKKTYSYSGTIGDTQQPHINVCFTNHSFNAKINAQLIEGNDEISVISFECCGGNKVGTFPTNNIQPSSIQVFGPASTNPWNVSVVTDKTTVALKPSGAIDTSGEYHISIEYMSAKTGGAVSNIIQDTTQQIAFGY